jgi:tetrahydromethanopterin S-methyltransferase subunit G
MGFLFGVLVGLLLSIVVIILGVNKAITDLKNTENDEDL